jgi:HEAT repeat protein
VKHAGSTKRAEAMLVLAERDSSDSVRDLTLALDDPAPRVRASAALALASMRDPVATSALTAIVAGWRDPGFARCRRAALSTLAAFRSEEAAAELAGALATARPDEAPDLEDRSALLMVVYAEPTGVAAPRVVRSLVGLLAHDYAADRAVSLLGLFPSESYAPLARVLRVSRIPSVRRRAARALSACRRDTVVSALIAALDDPAPEVRAEATRSLGAMRDPAAAGPLQRVAGDPDDSVCAAARSALQALGAVATASKVAAGVTRLAERST